MAQINENDLLRLSMILDNQGTTTLDKYICKLAEYSIFSSSKNELTAIEIIESIKTSFSLDFDVIEVENAIHRKGKDRIITLNNSYQLSPKVNNQLSNQESTENQLKRYVDLFARQSENDINQEELLKSIKKYLYYSFNSNVDNFVSIIGTKDQINIDRKKYDGDYFSDDEVELLNNFISWDNTDKDKLLYYVISCCYEYCLITTKKNTALSSSIFKGKKFFLDTNIIFRIAGINKEDRQFVLKTFVDRCKDVGISLCYSSDVLNEVYRVVDLQIQYISRINQGQYPVNPNLICKLSENCYPNDFYILYYNWCKEPQNKYNDYMSFRNYLLGLINSSINELDYVDSSRIRSGKGYNYEDLSTDLKTYKTEKRPNRNVTDESIKTDINQITYVDSIRPKTAKTLWEMNEYIVSADQVLISWSNERFSGVPLVVIPSVWLSIILKISGRASDDDYKSFCLFMTLRHHHTDEENININPIELLSRISTKTVNVQIKERIISEILTNKASYSLVDNDLDSTIELAFDKILEKENGIRKEELLKAVEEERLKGEKNAEEYKEALKNKKSDEEFAQRFANNKSQKKVAWFSERENIPLVIEGFSFALLILFFLLCYILKVKPFVNLMTKSNEPASISLGDFSCFTWIYGVFTATLPGYIKKVWGYLSSDKRREKLCSKYYKKQIKTLNYK